MLILFCFQLYDLMVMATKHQILICRNPRHLVMITLNHIDAIMDFTTNPAVKQNIQTAYELLIQVNGICLATQNSNLRNISKIITTCLIKHFLF